MPDPVPSLSEVPQPVPGMLSEAPAEASTAPAEGQPVPEGQTSPAEGSQPPEGQAGQTPQTPAPAKSRADYVREALEGRAQRQAAAQQSREAQQLAQFQAQQAQERARWEQLEGEARTDPMAFLRRYGHTFDDLARRAINMPADAEKPLSPREQKIQQQLEEINKWRAEQEQQRQQQQQAWQQQQAVQAVQAHIRGRLELAAKSPDEFELVTQFPDQAGEMYRQTYWRVYHEVLGGRRDLDESEMTECMRYVEGELEKKQAEHLSKLEKSKKFASRFVPKTPAPTSEPATAIKTITNDAARPIPSAPPKANGTSGLTAEQIREQHETSMMKDPRFVKFFAQ